MKTITWVASIAFTIACVGLSVARFAMPNLPIDTVTIALLLLSFVGILFPILLPSIKKVKIGDVEIEREINKFQEDIYNIKRKTSQKLKIPAKTPLFAIKILEQAAREPEVALLSLCAQLEIEVRRRLDSEAGELLSLEEGIKIGIQQGVFSEECLTAFKQWWKIKEYLRSGLFNVRKSAILSVISYGIDLLSIITASNKSIV